MPDTIFDFEKDFAGSLRCIPMAVRLKLDLIGIKLSLRQWSQLNHDQRANLLKMPYQSPRERQAITAAIYNWVTASGGAVDHIEPADGSAWSCSGKVPDVVVAQANDKQLLPPTPDQWRALTDQQRFALIKLTRPGHENQNFVPAVHEFGLLGRNEGPS